MLSLASINKLSTGQLYLQLIPVTILAATYRSYTAQEAAIQPTMTI